MQCIVHIYQYIRIHNIISSFVYEKSFFYIKFNNKEENYIEPSPLLNDLCIRENMQIKANKIYTRLFFCALLNILLTSKDQRIY